MDNFTLKDSGQRRQFATGAVRDRGDLKPRPDLISPHAQMREGMVLARGAEKYAARNWERGIPIGECLASAQRHIEQYKLGQRDEDHLAQARTNLGFALHFEEEIAAGRMDPAINDMPRYEQTAPLNRRLPFAERIEPADHSPICGCDDCTAVRTAKPGEAICVQDVKHVAEHHPFRCDNFGCVNGSCPECQAARRLSEHVAECPGTCPVCGKQLIGKPPGCPGHGFYAKIAGHESGLAKRVADGELLSDRENDQLQAATKLGPEKPWEGLKPDPAVQPGLAGPTIGTLTLNALLPKDVIRILARSEKPVIYISGPMRGIRFYNFAAFDAARDFVREHGGEPISPADVDRAFSLDPFTWDDAKIRQADEQDWSGTTSDDPEHLRSIVLRDTAVIASLRPERGDFVLTLPGWENSTGAQAEVRLADWLGLPVQHVEAWPND